MSGVGVFMAVVVGILAGWVADLVLARRHGLFTRLLIGVVGAFIGAFVAQRLQIPFDGFFGSLLVSSLGATFFLAVLGLFRRSA